MFLKGNFANLLEKLYNVVASRSWKLESVTQEVISSSILFLVQ